jgi:uncharacterized membrane protein YedE/YeeE
MAHFTPESAAVGGALIGLAVVLLMVLNGRVAGISGIFGDAVLGVAGSGWRLAFLAGMILAPLAWTMVGGTFAAPTMPVSWVVVVGGGLLVGFGTRLSGGCTSGHGLCGNARLSPRSVVATLTFMAVGVIVVALVRHVVGG